MVLNDKPQTFLFTFRPNGEAHGFRLAEVHVQQLADYDPSIAEGAYTRHWYGTEESLTPMLAALGIAPLDIEGVTAALGSHREADRRLAVTPDQLHQAGFQQPA